MDLSIRTFELVENADGLAASETRISFAAGSIPFRGTYQGPNIIFGQVLVSEVDGTFRMLYHALTASGELVAGKADVSFLGQEPLRMQLNWQWLAGDLSSGTSNWIEVHT